MVHSVTRLIFHWQLHMCAHQESITKIDTRETETQHRHKHAQPETQHHTQAHTQIHTGTYGMDADTYTDGLSYRLLTYCAGVLVVGAPVGSPVRKAEAFSKSVAATRALAMAERLPRIIVTMYVCVYICA